MRPLPLLPAALGLLLSVPFLGCADAAGGREPVSGHVRFQGRPLDQGTIQFIPLDGQDTTSGGPVRAGDYQVARKQGLQPGRYRVLLSSGTPGRYVPDEAAPGAPSAPTQERLPKEYNAESRQTVAVQKGGPNRFDFDIP